MRYQEEYNKLLKIREESERTRDRETAHADADEILLEILEKEGLEHIVSAYHRIEKWYA